MIEELAELMASIELRGVTSQSVLRAMSRVDRSEFVLTAFAKHAYQDIPLPLQLSQTISQPTIVGLMTQALEIEKNHRVLEVGTGSGYQTMILSLLCRHVYSIERYQSLAEKAKRLLIGKHKLGNLTLMHGDGALGLAEAAPFDRVLITAAPEDVPPVLIEQLKDDGIMVLPIGVSPSEQFLMQIIKKPGRETVYNNLGGVRFVRLLEGVRNE